MAITKTVNTSELYHDLKQTSGYQNNFSYDGAKALMEYLGLLADECDMNIEYDPIAFCCEYSEYSSLEDFNKNYNSAAHFDNWEQIEENTTVIRFGIDQAIVQDF